VYQRGDGEEIKSELKGDIMEGYFVKNAKGAIAKR